MFTLLAQQLECYATQFDVPQAQNSHPDIYYTLTNRGIEKYGQTTLDEFFVDLLGHKIGNITFSVLGFEFNLNNLIMTQVTNPQILIMLNEGKQYANVVLKGMRFGLAFEFVTHQTTYPYLHDEGTGSLILEVDTIQMDFQAKQSEECPGQLHYTADNGDARLQTLRIKFESGLSYLYDAILPTLESYLVDQFNEAIGKQFVSFLVEFANQNMQGMNPVSSLTNVTQTVVDQRWIGDVIVGDRVFTIGSSGMTGRYFKDGETQIYTSGLSYGPLPRAKFMVNRDITYEISRNAFSSAFQYIWELNGSMIEQDLGVTDLAVEVQRISKSGVVSIVNYTRDGKRFAVQTIGNLTHKQHEQIDRNLTVAWFRPQLTKIVDSAGETSENAQRIVSYMDRLLDSYALTVLNGYNIDLQNALVVYVNDDWVFVGAEMRPDK